MFVSLLLLLSKILKVVKKERLHIVGDLEADISEGRISIGSPLAKALLGKKVDDEVEVKVPKGIVEYLITSVEYE